MRKDEEILIPKKDGYIQEYVIQSNLIQKLKETYSELKDNQTFMKWVKEINTMGKLGTDDLLRLVYEKPKYKEYLNKSKIKHKFNLDS